MLCLSKIFLPESLTSEFSQVYLIWIVIIDGNFDLDMQLSF